jgi:hexosaminidase
MGELKSFKKKDFSQQQICYNYMSVLMGIIMTIFKTFSGRVCTIVASIIVLFLAGCVPFRKEAKRPKPSPVQVIPRPAQVSMQKSTFRLIPGTPIIYTDTDLAFSAQYLQKFLWNLTGKPSEAIYNRQVPAGNGIILTLNNHITHPEGYRLEVEKNILLEAGEPRGVFYGIQTLVQLLFSGSRSMGAIVLPAVQINDQPRFSWRGMHLDVSRHFFDKEFIKKYIDILALHKMNTFHWHLVDDQGWRLEIKKYLRLTEVGAWRVDMEDIPWNFRPDPQPGEKPTYGGFYTQDDIREVVKYAADRFITIVPEIEMPAHVQSALAAYPRFSCKQVPLMVPAGGVWPITNIYCAGNDSTFIFLQDILSEVMDLFPSKYIHIGGDEADKTEWKQCPRCQNRIQQEGLGDEEELQSYFIRRIESFLNAHNRILIGWDEILQGGLADNAMVMSWRGTRGGIRAARMGHDAVMTPIDFCYFNYYQSPDRDLEPYAIGGFTDLLKVYSYEPVPDELNGKEAKHILGVQGNVWSEYLLTGSQVEYMALPRITALSEVQWTPARLKDKDDFLRRLPALLDLLTNQGINYYVPAPQGLLNKMVFMDSIGVDLKNPLPFGEIRFTLSGKDPELVNSTEYKKPLTFFSDTLLKTAVFLKNGRRSLVRSTRIARRDPMKSVNPATTLSAGLRFDYYEGEIYRLQDFGQLEYRQSGILDTVGIPAEISEDHFGLKISGYIKVPHTGVYTFTLSSNDGSRLTIGDENVVTNDGIHGYQDMVGQIALEKGLHPLRIDYFEFEGWQGINLTLAGPDLPEQTVPAEWFFRE